MQTDGKYFNAELQIKKPHLCGFLLTKTSTIHYELNYYSQKDILHEIVPTFKNFFKVFAYIFSIILFKRLKHIFLRLNNMVLY